MTMSDPVEDFDLLHLYLQKRFSLVRFFAARLGSIAAAEDLVQELYLKLSALEPDSKIDNPSAFLFRAAQNLMLDRLRQDRRATRRDDSWAVAQELRAGEPAVDDALAARRRLARLAELVEEMPAKMRQAFRLHKIEGLSQAETATAMDISVSAVEKHISAALKLLLRKID
jgi:RNA polymerase sigma-70 factor (ECF subfamily)